MSDHCTKISLEIPKLREITPQQTSPTEKHLCQGKAGRGAANATQPHRLGSHTDCSVTQREGRVLSQTPSATGSDTPISFLTDTLKLIASTLTKAA